MSALLHWFRTPASIPHSAELPRRSSRKPIEILRPPPGLAAGSVCRSWPVTTKALNTASLGTRLVARLILCASIFAATKWGSPAYRPTRQCPGGRNLVLSPCSQWPRPTRGDKHNDRAGRISVTPLGQFW